MHISVQNNTIMQKNNYHKIIITITILLCTAISAKAQSNPINIGTSLSDTIAVMKHLEKRKSEFIGKPLAIFLKEYERYLPIRFMASAETSPWIHPEGKCFVEAIIICFRDYDFLMKTIKDKEGSFVLRIEFMNPRVEYSTFWDQFPETMTDQEKANLIEDKYKIKDISSYLFIY